MYKYQRTPGESLQPEFLSSHESNMKYPHKVLSNLTQFAIRGTAGKSLPNIVPIFSTKKFSSDGGSSGGGGGGGSLLKYPALKLEETLPKWLKSVKPLVTETEYKDAEGAVKKFQDKEGKELQEILEKEAEKEKNWLAERWLKVAYLQYRDPVTIYSSPGMIFPLTTFSSQDEWLQYTANVINAIAHFKLMVDEGKMPVQKMGKHELDNSQFGKIFGTNRRPARKEDEVSYYPDSKHVVVLYKNHFFKLPIFNEECKPISPELLKKALTSVIAHKKEKGVEYGLLSTDNRDNWAESYEVLKKQCGNDKILCEIETALFTVSLDECVEYWSDRAWDEALHQVIHGGGSEQNSANRWMDKTIQLIVNRNGMSGFTYEHSPAEGQGIAMIIDFVVAKLKDPKSLEGAEAKEFCVDYLRFADPHPCIEQWISVAKRNIDNMTKNFDIRILHFEDFGKEFIKEKKFSPDSFIQIALQLAFYRMYNEPGAQYETAHLRIFEGGRTETIRSCSEESVAFAKAMLDKNGSVEDRCEKMVNAIKSHRDYTTMALNGKGVDRHLLGLKLMAIENKKPIPEFYSTPAFTKSVNFRVSTSQVASQLPVFMSYGPITRDGYACCYNPRDCDMFLAITSWKSHPAEKFAKAVASSLKEMEALCNNDYMKKANEQKDKSDGDNAPKSKL